MSFMKNMKQLAKFSQHYVCMHLFWPFKILPSSKIITATEKLKNTVSLPNQDSSAE